MNAKLRIEIGFSNRKHINIKTNIFLFSENVYVKMTYNYAIYYFQKNKCHWLCVF